MAIQVSSADELYDTRSSTRIAAYERKGHSGCWYREALYRTADGQYFLSGIGGSLSAYRKLDHFGSWVEGQRIIPLTEDDAELWMRGPHNIFHEEFFGPVSI